MIVSEILSRKGTGVFTIAPEATVAVAIGQLQQHNVGALVVSSDGKKVVGILSERDIVHALDLRSAGLLECRVSEIMTRMVVTCRLDSSGADILDFMINGRFRHLPVIDNGVLCGIVSMGDVVKFNIQGK